MDKFTLFTGGAFLLSNHKDHQKNDLSITFGKASKCLTALLLLLFMGFSSFASSSTTLATENNTNSFSCNAKASDIWLVASNGREIQVSNGQQLCLSDIGFDRGFVRVRTSGDVGSVKIWVKGAASKDNTENYEPYDSKTFDLIAGDYNITTKIFSQPSGHGEQCDDRTFNFSIKECNTAPACNGESSDIWLVGSNGREIQVSNGQQLCLSDIGFNNARVRVRTSGHVGSLKIWVKGAVSRDNTENHVPYDSKSFDLKIGDYNVTAKIFSESSGRGEQCDDRTFNFSIKECNPAPCTSRVWFKNTGCQKVEVFKREDGRDQHVGSINPNGTREVDTYKGQRFTFKVNDQEIKSWTVSSCNNSTQNIDTGGCNTATCDGKATDIWLVGNNGGEVRINNGGELCLNSLGFSHGFVRVGTSGHVGSMRIWVQGAVNNDVLENYATYDSRSFDFRAGTYNITAKIFSESDGRGNTCSERTVSFRIKECQDARPDCNDISISTSRGRITISGLDKAPISSVQVVRKKDGKQVFTCHNNCDGTEKINVSGGDYWLKVDFFTSSWQFVCQETRDIHVEDNDLTSNDTAASGRISRPTTSQLTTTSVSKTGATNQVITTTTTDEGITKIGTTTSTLVPVEVYPNPASTTLFISNSRSGQAGELTLFNQFGQVMNQIDLSTIAKGSLQIDISAYQPGLYLVSTRLKSGEIYTEKLLIQ